MAIFWLSYFSICRFLSRHGSTTWQIQNYWTWYHFSRNWVRSTVYTQCCVTRIIRTTPHRTTRRPHSRGSPARHVPDMHATRHVSNMRATRHVSNMHATRHVSNTCRATRCVSSACRYAALPAARTCRSTTKHATRPCRSATRIDAQTCRSATRDVSSTHHATRHVVPTCRYATRIDTRPGRFATRDVSSTCTAGLAAHSCSARHVSSTRPQRARSLSSKRS